MQDVTITVEIRMKNKKFLTKYDYILNIHKVIRYNNKLQILGWHLLLFITNCYHIITECSAIGTSAGDPDRKIPFIGNEYSEICNSLRTSLVADCFE